MDGSALGSKDSLCIFVQEFEVCTTGDVGEKTNWLWIFVQNFARFLVLGTGLALGEGASGRGGIGKQTGRQMNHSWI